MEQTPDSLNGRTRFQHLAQQVSPTAKHLHPPETPLDLDQQQCLFSLLIQIQWAFRWVEMFGCWRCPLSQVLKPCPSVKRVRCLFHSAQFDWSRLRVRS